MCYRVFLSLLVVTMVSCGTNNLEFEILDIDTQEPEDTATESGDSEAEESDSITDSGGTTTDTASESIEEECQPDELTQLPIPCTCEQTHPDAPTAAPCLLAHWKFDGDASDIIGRFDGEELFNVTYIEGVSGKAVDLDASSHDKAHVRIASDAIDQITPGTLNPDSLSVAFWIRTPTSRSSNEEGQIIERGRPCLNYWGCTMTKSEISCGFNPGLSWCSGIERVDAKIDPVFWHHIAFTLKRSENYLQARLRLYIDGILVTSRDLEGEYPNDTLDQQRYLVLGRNYIDPEGGQQALKPWYGQLDDLRIYRGELTPDQVERLYQSY